MTLGLSQSLVEKIASYRAGLDGLERTEDDRWFKDLGGVANQLETVETLNDAERNNFSEFIEKGVLTVSSSYFKIKSKAELHHRNESLTISCIADRNGIIYDWRETFET